MASIDTSVSKQVYLSRDQIRLQITEFMQTYLELENVDLTKSSFLSFMVNILSTLTSNLLFYETSVYREFFMTTAQLPESVLNLSAFLGYNTKEATYAYANILVTIPLGFDDADTTFSIPEGFKFKSGTIEFATYYNTTINVLNNETVRILAEEGTKTYVLPVEIDLDVPSFSFIISTRQYKYSEQEFQIDNDIDTYQFVTIDVPAKGQVSNLTIQLKDPDTQALVEYTEFASLYLMASTDYGFVSRRTAAGRKIYFGNGLIGVQPLPGSTVIVTVYETEGADGNVIQGSINNGEKIYITNNSLETKILNYTCTNTSPATNGEDEESIQDVKSNAIKNLVSMNRLVSEIDYNNVDVVIPYSPFKTAPLAVLKRSDIKCNEIQLYSNLDFNGELVPTRNEKVTVDHEITNLPRGTIITSGDKDYLTLFDMTIDTLNGAAYYEYILYSVNITPSLNTTYDSTYDGIVLQNLDVYLDSTTGDAVVRFNYTGTDTTASCVMNLIESDHQYNMTNDTVNSYFEYIFSPYTLFPSGDIITEFTISSEGSSISTYSATITLRKSLDEFMMSNVVSDSTSTMVYDIPVVESEYYNSINKEDFEIQVLQYMMASLSFSDYRMITDFVNVKFTNTIGPLINMTRNPVSKASVKSLSQSFVPTADLGDRYIVNGQEGNEWLNQKNKIAQCIDSTAQTWYFFYPVLNDIVYVDDELKNYIYTGTQWFCPEYEIPLQIEIEIIKADDYYGSNTELTNLVRTTIIDNFSDRFGSNIEISRTEIIKIIRQLEEVGDCNLIKPESNIFFNFNIDDFTQDELLEYTPEYVYFGEDDITVRILG